jgi:hypothetical protein
MRLPFPICLALVLCVAGAVQTAAAVEPAAPATPDAVPPPAATPQPGPAWQHLSRLKLEAEVRSMLYDGQYEALDSMVRELNDKRSRFTDGVWKLTTFFDGVDRPLNTYDAESWKVLFQRLEEWDQHSPTVFSENAIGCAKVNFAWLTAARWQGRPPTQEEEIALATALASAVETYERVLRNPQKCVDVYAQLLRIGQFQRWPSEKMEATLREAISVAPDYYPCFDRFAMDTLPSWGGKPGDTRHVFDSIPSLVPEDQAYDVYTRLALTMHRFYKDGFFGKDGIVEWFPMKKGFERIIRIYPKEPVIKNKFAAYAYLAGDRPTARALLDELMKQNAIEYNAWLPVGGFEKAKKWILESP